MKISDVQKNHFLSSMPKEIPLESRHKIIEFIEKITDLFEEDEFTPIRLSEFGIACTITSQVLKDYADDLISKVKTIEKNNLKSKTIH